VLAEDAIKSAIADFRKKQQSRREDDVRATNTAAEPSQPTVQE
jgi:hypothetical protein